MNAQRLKVLQIGTAHDHAADIYETLLALPGDYELAGVCEPNEELRRSAASGRFAKAKWLPLEEALTMPGLDAVIVESEEKKLLEYAQPFADRGIPIHMDKPCGEDYAAFARLINTLEKKNLPFHTGYMYRYNPGVKYCLALKESGKLGDIFSVEANMSVHHCAAKRAWLSRFQGGMMFFLGCHLIDLVYTFCGEPLEVIPCNAATGNEGVGSLDYAFAVFRYAQGVSFIKTCASEVGGNSRRMLAVCGTKGTACVEPLEAGLPGPNFWRASPVRTMFLDGNQEGPWQQVQLAPFGRYLDMMHTFARIVRGEQKNPYTYQHELAVQRLVLQACGAWKGQGQ